jgi:phosphohistidine swiveling domain-containing protein
MTLILPLDELRAQMLAEVGGKAANLGELCRAGLPVPPGFCVTTEAYRLAAEAATDLAGALDASDLGELAGRARAALLAAPIPDRVRTAVLDAYHRLGTEQDEEDTVPVAVRSSATAEDLPHASFAGQQDTYLNVVGPDAVLDAVRRCWASLWTDRAVSYRAGNGVDHAAVQLAVVVQRMVQARVAGVMFTANPVTGRRGEAVIDASPGLGESVVSGSVNPDRFVVDTERGAILLRRLGDKREVIRSVPGGGTERITVGDGADRACLTDEQVHRLVAMGRAAQAHFGAPQDTEWAFDAAGEPWLTQARPITTLYPLPADPPPDPGRTRVYFNATLAQGLIRPITPMGIAAFRAISSGASTGTGGPPCDPLAGSRMLVVAGQRLFIDVTGVLASPVGRRLVPRLLDVMEARSAVILRELARDPRFARTGSWWQFPRRLLPVLVRYRILPRVAEGMLRPAAARRRLDEFGVSLRRRLEPTAGTGAQRLDHVERVLGSCLLDIVTTVGPVALGSAFGLFGMAAALLRRDAAPGELATVLRGLPHNVTTEMDLRLWELAAVLRADDAAATRLRELPPAELATRYLAGELPASVQRGVAGFLRRYGHRAVAEIDIGLPRWSEDPTHLFGVLANYLRCDDAASTPSGRFDAGRRVAQDTVTRLVAAARRRGRTRGALVGFGLRRARQLAGLRELPKYHLVEVLACARRELAGLGRELAEAGLLDAADDIFWLDLAQARSALHGADHRRLVARRRAEYQSELRRRQVPRVMLSDGTEPEALGHPTDSADGDLVGTAASAGTATGIARVVLDPVGAHLEPGEVLVAPSTDPGWTPLFLTAGALVMEMGGANSHGAVVAREYGIPAVVGVPGATTRIVTGQRVTVHGAEGRVSPGRAGSESPAAHRPC